MSLDIICIEYLHVGGVALLDSLSLSLQFEQNQCVKILIIIITGLIGINDYDLLNIRVAVWYFSYVNSALNPFVYAFRNVCFDYNIVQLII